MSAISAADYRERLLAQVRRTRVRPVALRQAAGHVLAEDVHARVTIPPFDNSAMDGYAVRAGDVATATVDAPVVLPVADDIPAGRTDRLTLAPGTAARIMTGAPMPDGADTVVQVEATDGGTVRVSITEPRETGTHVRRAGDDLAVGDLVLRAGTRLTARHLGAVAAAGLGELPVHTRPQVAVLSTGSELVPAGESLDFGQIHDSNSHVLAASAAEAGCEVVHVGSVADDEDELRDTLARISPQVDAIILSGGVSVGAYDVVKAVLAPLSSMWFGPVAMQPGKPQGSGTLEDGTLVITLPGNPVSVYVSFEVFVRSALRRLAGETEVAPRFLPARAAVDWGSPAGREQYMPVTIDHAGVTPLVHPASRRGSGSHLVGGLAGADGLARVAAEVTQVRVGDELEVLEGTR